MSVQTTPPVRLSTYVIAESRPHVVAALLHYSASVEFSLVSPEGMIVGERDFGPLAAEEKAALATFQTNHQPAFDAATKSRSAKDQVAYLKAMLSDPAIDVFRVKRPRTSGKKFDHDRKEFYKDGKNPGVV